jgi:hypothetical protein
MVNKGYILRVLKKKYQLATKGVHGVQRVNGFLCLLATSDVVKIYWF